MISTGFGALPIRPNVFTRLLDLIRLCLCGVIISNSIYISGPEHVTIVPSPFASEAYLFWSL